MTACTKHQEKGFQGAGGRGKWRSICSSIIKCWVYMSHQSRKGRQVCHLGTIYKKCTFPIKRGYDNIMFLNEMLGIGAT